MICFAGRRLTVLATPPSNLERSKVICAVLANGGDPRTTSVRAHLKRVCITRATLQSNPAYTLSCHL